MSNSQISRGLKTKIAALVSNVNNERKQGLSLQDRVVDLEARPAVITTGLAQLLSEMDQLRREVNWLMSQVPDDGNRPIDSIAPIPPAGPSEATFGRFTWHDNTVRDKAELLKKQGGGRKRVHSLGAANWLLVALCAMVFLVPLAFAQPYSSVVPGTNGAFAFDSDDDGTHDAWMLYDDTNIELGGASVAPDVTSTRTMGAPALEWGSGYFEVTNTSTIQDDDDGVVTVNDSLYGSGRGAFGTITPTATDQFTVISQVAGDAAPTAARAAAIALTYAVADEIMSTGNSVKAAIIDLLVRADDDAEVLDDVAALSVILDYGSDSGTASAEGTISYGMISEVDDTSGAGTISPLPDLVAAAGIIEPPIAGDHSIGVFGSADANPRTYLQGLSGSRYAGAFNGDVDISGDLDVGGLVTGIDYFYDIITNSGTATPSGAATLSLLGSGIVSTARSGNTITITGTEVDGSTTNELPLLSADLGNNLLGVSGQTLSLDNQSANLVFAGPATGSAAAPTFRSIVDADVPNNITITEADTLATVTGRGATTSTATTFNGNLTHGDASTDALALNSTISTDVRIGAGEDLLLYSNGSGGADSGTIFFTGEDMDSLSWASGLRGRQLLANMDRLINAGTIRAAIFDWYSQAGVDTFWLSENSGSGGHVVGIEDRVWLGDSSGGLPFIALTDSQSPHSDYNDSGLGDLRWDVTDDGWFDVLTAGSGMRLDEAMRASGGSGPLAIGGELMFQETSGLNGDNFVALVAPASLAGDVTYTLPTADGTSGYQLSTNGSGTLSWTAPGGTEADTLATVTARGDNTLDPISVGQATVDAQLHVHGIELGVGPNALPVLIADGGDGAEEVSGDGGNGGLITLNAGDGADAPDTFQGGSGGSVTISAGVGGDSGGADGIAGNGGNVTISSAAAGAPTGGSPGTDGDVLIQPGGLITKIGGLLRVDNGTLGTNDTATGPGDIYAEDALEADGNVAFGDADGDEGTVTGDWAVVDTEWTDLGLRGIGGFYDVVESVPDYQSRWVYCNLGGGFGWCNMPLDFEDGTIITRLRITHSFDTWDDTIDIYLQRMSGSSADGSWADVPGGSGSVNAVSDRDTPEMTEINITDHTIAANYAYRLSFVFNSNAGSDLRLYQVGIETSRREY